MENISNISICDISRLPRVADLKKYIYKKDNKLPILINIRSRVTEAIDLVTQKAEMLKKSDKPNHIKKIEYYKYLKQKYDYAKQGGYSETDLVQYQKITKSQIDI